MGSLPILVLFFGPLLALIVRRRFRRAWVWWGLVLLAMAGAAIAPWSFYAAFVLLLALLVDAIRIARRPAPAEPSVAVPSAQVAPLRAPQRRALHAVGIAVASVAVVTLLRTYVIETYQITSTGDVPTLSAGDHIVAEKLSLRFRGVERGELVVFPYPCGPRTPFVERIVALGGDRVEIRCGRLYVDGAAVPTEAVPGRCEYLDRDDRSGAWRPVTCERRRERLGDHAHDIVHRPQAAPADAALHDFPPSEAAAVDGGPLFYCSGSAVGEVVSGAAPVDACAPQRQFVVPDGHVFLLGDNRDSTFDSRSWGPVPTSSITGRVVGVWWSHSRSTGLRWDRVGAVR